MTASSFEFVHSLVTFLYSDGLWERVRAAASLASLGLRGGSKKAAGKAQ